MMKMWWGGAACGVGIFFIAFSLVAHKSGDSVFGPGWQFGLGLGVLSLLIGWFVSVTAKE